MPVIQNLLLRVRLWLSAHKVLAGILFLGILGGGWYTFQKLTSTSGETRYVLGQVSSDTIVAAISGSGQVSSGTQLDIKSKAAGDIVYIGVEAGQKVAAGKLIAQIDDTDAQKNIRDAEANLESALIALEKIKKPADNLTLLQAQNALTTAQDSQAKDYKDALTDVSNAFLDFPNIIEELKDIDLGTDTNHSLQWNIDFYLNAIEQYDPKARSYRDTAYTSYLAAKKSYDTAFDAYQLIGVSADEPTTEKLLSDTYRTAQDLLAAIKAANAFLQFYVDTMNTHNVTPSVVATEDLTTLTTHLATVNTHLSTLLANSDTIKGGKQTIAEKRASLEDAQAGSDALDIRNAELNVTKAKNALADAKTKLADYYIRAPFTGTVASVAVKKFDSASNAASIATLVTDQKIAELSMNEVDAAKIQVGQRVTLTLDAIEGLTLTGKVAEIDTVGTVSQGVVSYTVKIGFDTQDPRVKPGMTVNADIQTAVAQDALVVPATAVKSQNGSKYVLVFDPPLSEAAVGSGSSGVASKQAPLQVSVTIGISDDVNTEILSGLSVGQQIIVRTTSGTQTQTQQAPSIFGAPGGTRVQGGGGGNVRFVR